MKNKNPLYVVKGKDVHQADSVLDLVIKRLNLMPMVTVLKNLLQFLLEQVKTFAMYEAVMHFVNEVMTKAQALKTSALGSR